MAPATAARAAASTSGAWAASWASSVAAVATNMPLFHRCRPPATYPAAVGASGFSTKRATDRAPSSPGSAAPASM